MADKIKCAWCLKDQLYQDYHDQEWGIPVHEDQVLFEMLLLEGAQAGLSWYTVLVKREHYRKVFNGFDAAKMARYDQGKVESLLNDPGIIRNRLKVNTFITNAQAYLNIRETGTFDELIWQFTDGKTIVNHPKKLQEVPAKTAESDAMSKELKKRGFKFVGSTICYAFMQACGMVDDHLVDCWRKNPT